MADFQTRFIMLAVGILVIPNSIVLTLFIPKCILILYPQFASPTTSGSLRLSKKVDDAGSFRNGSSRKEKSEKSDEKISKPEEDILDQALEAMRATE